MRNLDIADSRSKLEQYAGLAMVGGPDPMLIGATQIASTGLIGAMPEGGAQAIASRGATTGEDDTLLDHAAMEAGTD
jgi:argininosuccinate synthase